MSEPTLISFASSSAAPATTASSTLHRCLLPTMLTPFFLTRRRHTAERPPPPAARFTHRSGRPDNSRPARTAVRPSDRCAVPAHGRAGQTRVELYLRAGGRTTDRPQPSGGPPEGPGQASSPRYALRISGFSLRSLAVSVGTIRPVCRT